MSLFAHIFITRNFKKIRDQIKHIVLWQTCPKFWESHPPRKRLSYTPVMSRLDVSKRKLLWGSFISKTSVIISGAKLFFTLNISVANIWRFRWCIVTELSSSKRPLKVSLLSLYTSLKALSCILLIQLFNWLLWNIQIKGQ